MVWLERACTKDYTLTNSKGQKIQINRDDHVVVPISGFHYDPNYFSNPEKFDPERFSEENKQESAVAYMPFGLGPRRCIAGRLALMQNKIFFIHLLSKFTIIKNEKTQVPIQYQKGMAFLRAANGIWLDLKLRQNI